MHCLVHAVIVVGLSVGKVRFVELQEDKLLLQCQTNILDALLRRDALVLDNVTFKLSSLYRRITRN